MATRLAFFLGIVLLGVAGTILVVDIVSASHGGGFHPTALGDFLFALAREALDRLRIAIQGHLSANLWDTVIAPVLRLPAALFFGLPGLILVGLALLRRRAVHGNNQIGA